MNKKYKIIQSNVFRKKNQVSISIKAYATLFNRLLNILDSKKERYSFNKINEEIQKGKSSRAILIIWAHKYNDNMIALPLAMNDEHTSEYNKNHSFKIKINGNWGYIMLDPLFMKKTKTFLYPDKTIYGKSTDKQITEIFEFWKTKPWKKGALVYTLNQINKYERNVLQSQIKYLKEKEANK